MNTDYFDKSNPDFCEAEKSVFIRFACVISRIGNGTGCVQKQSK